MSDYDQIEKIFTGSWKYDRDENTEAFMEAMGNTNFLLIDFYVSTKPSNQSQDHLANDMVGVS